VTRLDRRAVGALVGAVALLAGGGAALGASAGGDHSARCDQRLARIAERRGVSVEQLEASIQARLLARIDAAEKSGRISGERAAKLRERVSDGSLCATRHVRARITIRGMLRAAAGFLGLDRQELRAELPGDSLASLAAKQGKSKADLEAAMLAPAKARLAKAVASGKLAHARADALLERLAHVAERLATKEFPA
jgi:hypothetical protein